MTTALKIERLEKRYGSAPPALKGIGFRVEQGEFLALLGPNGAGKSTTIGIVCGLVNKSGGRVEIFGHDIDADFPRAKTFVGLVPQEFNFNQFEKVFDICVTQAGYYGIPAHIGEQRAEKYLRRLGLWEKRNEQSRTLSGGMKRRLMIARALVHEPKLLILDEPTAGVDIELRRSMWDFLREINRQGTTIILTTHYLEEAESLCRRVCIIDKGEIVEDTDTRSLLGKLSLETFVLDIEGRCTVTPALEGYACRLTDPHTLEVDVPRGQDINTVFSQLSAQGVRVLSLRNRANRLEELFVALVQRSLPPAEAGGSVPVAGGAA
ncbi:MAG: ABC transporter ATP-binding protein [Pseudomonadota bacterium]